MIHISMILKRYEFNLKNALYDYEENVFTLVPCNVAALNSSDISVVSVIENKSDVHDMHLYKSLFFDFFSKIEN